MERVRDIHEKHQKEIGLLDRFALSITTMVGTMACFFIFCVLASISLPAAVHSHDPLVIVSWIAQTFLQLVLLPLIMVGQNIQSKESDRRARIHFEVDQKAEKEIEEIMKKLKLIHKHIHK